VAIDIPDAMPEGPCYIAPAMKTHSIELLLLLGVPCAR